MSKPPPRLLRSMPHAKHAAKAIHEAIHTTSSSTSASGSASGRKAKRDLVQGLLALSVRGRVRAEDDRASQEVVGSGNASTVDGNTTDSRARRGLLTHAESSSGRPAQQVDYGPTSVRPGRAYRGLQSVHTSRSSRASSPSKPSAVRAYNTTTTSSSSGKVYNPLHSSHITSNASSSPSPFLFPQPIASSQYARWFFDSNSNATLSGTHQARPHSPPSPCASPEPDLPSTNASSAGAGSPTAGSTFTLAACTTSQHRHLPPTIVNKGKAREVHREQQSTSSRSFLSAEFGERAEETSYLSSEAGRGTSSSGGSLMERDKTVLIFHPGAYGIPKKRYTSTSITPPSYTHPNLPQGQTLTGAISSAPAHSTATRSTSTPSTSLQIGEDAYYTHPLSLGIADGVGGWSSSRNKGIRSRADPGRFSLLLMGYCEEEVKGWESGEERWMVDGGGDEGIRSGSHELASKRRRNPGHASNLAFGSGISRPQTRSQPPRPPASGQTWMFDPPSRSSAGNESSSSFGDEGDNLEEGIVLERVRKDLCPVEVMQRGYERCLASVKEEGLFGSATCLLAVLIDDELRVANLGDCALVVIRSGEIVFRTEEMQHSFNFPLQLGTNSRDEPMKDAQLFEVKVRRDDLVIMCSDGLVDNLFDEDILDIIASFAPPSSSSASAAPSSPSPLPPFSPQGVSEALCRAAKSASEEPGSPSPFMCKALDEGIDFLGGKKDDISVLVAVVQDRDRGSS